MKINSINLINNYKSYTKAKKAPLSFGQKPQYVSIRPDSHYFDMLYWMYPHIKKYNPDVKGRRQQAEINLDFSDKLLQLKSDDAMYARLCEDVVLFEDLLDSADNLLQEPDDISLKTDKEKLKIALGAKEVKSKIEDSKLMEGLYDMFEVSQKYHSDADAYQILKDISKCNSILLYSLKGGQRELFETIKRENPSLKSIIVGGAIDEEGFKPVLENISKIAEDYYKETKNHSMVYIGNCERFLYRNSPCIKDFQNFVQNCAFRYNLTIFLGTNNPELLDFNILDKKYISSRLFVYEGNSERKKQDAIKFMTGMNVDKEIQDKIIQKYFSSEDEVISLDSLKSAIVETQNKINSNQRTFELYEIELEKRKSNSTHKMDDNRRNEIETILSSKNI